MGELRLLSASIGLASCLVGTIAHAQCSKDVDCSADLICENGQCVTATAAKPLAPRVIVVHGPPVVEQPRYERRSPALIAVGSMAAVGGVVGLFIGLGSMGSTCHRELGDGFSVDHCVRSPDYLAYGLGGGALVGGTLLILIGAQKVPVEPSAQAFPWVAPGAAGLLLRIKL